MLASSSPNRKRARATKDRRPARTCTAALTSARTSTFFRRRPGDVADWAPLLVQASLPIELAEEVVNSDPVLSREICVPAGTPVKRWKNLQVWAQKADRPDSLQWSSLGRNASQHCAKCFGPSHGLMSLTWGHGTGTVFCPFETEA